MASPSFYPPSRGCSVATPKQRQCRRFTATDTEQHPTDVAGLRREFVTAIETEEGRSWAEAKIKKSDWRRSCYRRFMRQDFFEYFPQFKPIVAGNHKPGLRSVDEAIRGRLHLIPFTVTIPEEERDHNLAEKLKAEYPGILRWAIEGCLAWQQNGLNPPDIVRSATSEYMAAEDSVGRWMEERCVLDPCWCSSTALYRTTRAGVNNLVNVVAPKSGLPRRWRQGDFNERGRTERKALSASG